MRIGICLPWEKADLAARAGFDYVEVALRDLVARFGDDSARCRDQARALPLPVEAANLFLPPNLFLVGPQASPEALRAYARTALALCEAAGIRVAVLGSGHARRIAGVSGPQARRQLREALSLLDELAGDYGVRIALEPLRQAETDLVHRAEEAAWLVEGSRALGLVADTFHMAAEGEPLATLPRLGESLLHVHVACPGSRLPPGQGPFPAEELGAALRAAGYDGRISVEASWGDVAREAPAALAVLREVGRAREQG